IHTNKNESLSTRDYFYKMKKIFDTLDIGGLDDSYESLVTNILTRLEKGKAASPAVSKVFELISESCIEQDDIKEPFSEIITQGLRESGIFTSVIASANTTLSKDKILSSASARRVLEFIDDANYTLAIPPESPPGPDDLNIDI
ncbi:hypothetical protein CUMW_115680, partial [Citrus unshiu]